MSVQLDFTLPPSMNGTIQVALNPPAPISGWTIEFDLLYRFNSPQPLISKYMASGYTNGQSGITLVDGSKGIFNVSLSPLDVSGVMGTFDILAYQTNRTDSGFVTGINYGYRLCPSNF